MSPDAAEPSPDLHSEALALDYDSDPEDNAIPFVLVVRPRKRPIVPPAAEGLPSSKVPRRNCVAAITAGARIDADVHDDAGANELRRHVVPQKNPRKRALPAGGVSGREEKGKSRSRCTVCGTPGHIAKRCPTLEGYLTPLCSSRLEFSANLAASPLPHQQAKSRAEREREILENIFSTPAFDARMEESLQVYHSYDLGVAAGVGSLPPVRGRTGKVQQQPSINW